MPVDTDLFEEFMKAAQAAGKPEEPKRTLGEKYREEQLEKRGPPRLKDWYRTALIERAKLKKGEPGAYQPVLNALAMAEQKQKANVYTLSTSGIIKDPSDTVPLLGGDYSNTALLNRANRDTLWKAITGWEEPEAAEDTGIETSIFGKKVLPSPTKPPKGPSGQHPPIPAYVKRLSAADAGVVIPPINEWNYLDPPRAESGISYNQWGDPLPPFASGWGPLGRPNYGQGPVAPIRTAISNVYTGKALWGTTPKERGEGWYSQARSIVGIGKGSIPTMVANAFFSLVFPALNASAEGIERTMGTPSLLVEELATKSGLREMPEEAEAQSIAMVGIVLGQVNPLELANILTGSPPPVEEWIEDVVQRHSHPSPDGRWDEDDVAVLQVNVVLGFSPDNDVIQVQLMDLSGTGEQDFLGFGPLVISAGPGERIHQRQSAVKRLIPLPEHLSPYIYLLGIEPHHGYCDIRVDDVLVVESGQLVIDFLQV